MRSARRAYSGYWEEVVCFIIICWIILIYRQDLYEYLWEIHKNDKNVIGIHFGSTYSSVGVYKRGRVVVLENDEGSRVTPSFVSFTLNGDLLIGDQAMNYLTTNPESTISGIQKIIGRKFTDELVQKEIRNLNYKIINSTNRPMIEIKIGKNVTQFSPKEICAIILHKLKQRAELYLNKIVIRAIITIPLQFSVAQQEETIAAGLIAGFDIIKLISEPEAAAFGYGLDKIKEGNNIFVFQLSGQALTITILKKNKGMLEMVTSDIERNCGGEDFNLKVFNYFVKLWLINRRVNINNDKKAVVKLKREIERAKRLLSYSNQISIEIEDFYFGESFYQILSRSKFEELSEELFDSIANMIKTVMKRSDLKREEIHNVILVGGSTRIPKVKQLIDKYFENKTFPEQIEIENILTFGAVLESYKIQNEGDKLAASIGINLFKNFVERIFHKNSILPLRKIKQYQNQNAFRIYEGEAFFKYGNKELGIFVFDKFEPTLRGQYKIEVTFDIDINGVLTIFAKDLRSGRNEIYYYPTSQNLKTFEIKKLINDNIFHMEKENKAKERFVALNDLEKYIYSMRRNLIRQINNENCINLDLKDQQLLLNIIEQAIQWVEEHFQESTFVIKSYHEQIKEEINKISTRNLLESEEGILFNKCDHLFNEI